MRPGAIGGFEDGVGDGEEKFRLNEREVLGKDGFSPLVGRDGTGPLTLMDLRGVERLLPGVVGTTILSSARRMNWSGVKGEPPDDAKDRGLVALGDEIENEGTLPLGCR